MFVDKGPNDWNFTNTLPTANVSQFMFATSPLFFLLPKKFSKYHKALISLLSFGMLISPTLAMIDRFGTGYQFYPVFMCDYVAHFAFSLWGIYLVQTKQIELKKKEVLIGGAIIFSVAIVYMILNAIFDTAFFGLNLNGKHNIYTKVIVDNSYLSALLYFLALLLFLVVGYGYQKLILLFLIKTSKRIRGEQNV